MSAIVFTQEDLQKIIIQLLKKYNAEYGILFGSYARKQANENSDIDLIVVGGNSFDPTDIFCIAEDLHEMTNKNVDVYELREIEFDTPFYHNVISEGVRIA
ncbi:MAG: nucleotidyltransferase domain-containing protein [Ruminococcaceae bacterium]|jgi:predicted nucleotidyltransferase|nr:nucleotidyltransferase domain-containing protein [Oscillospiraceae bacterium]